MDCCTLDSDVSQRFILPCLLKFVDSVLQIAKISLRSSTIAHALIAQAQSATVRLPSHAPHRTQDSFEHHRSTYLVLSRSNDYPPLCQARLSTNALTVSCRAFASMLSHPVPSTLHAANLGRDVNNHNRRLHELRATCTVRLCKLT